MSDREYRKNHYVPVWYQKRFIPPRQRSVELYVLDLHPGTFRDPTGAVHQRRALKRLGPRFCFAERDLYNLHFDRLPPLRFNFLEIQTLRHLSEEEVRQINFIIKSRALRYVGAGREDWLYPERHVSKSDWNIFGHGYLLMPDPRAITFRGETFIGHRSGAISHFDAYGRRPWQQDYGRESNDRTEFKTLYRFKGEFAYLFGPTRRGRTFEHARLDPECDDDDFHQYHLSLWKGPRRR